MRAFICGGVELIASGIGDVVLVGSNHSAGTLRIREFLTRNGHPYAYIDLDTRRGRSAPARSVQRRGQRGPGAHLPRRRACCGIRPTGDRRVPRLQRRDRRRRTCATCSSSAPGRRGSRRPSTGRRRGSTSSCSSRTRRAGRPGSSSKIENYLGLPDGHVRPGACRARADPGEEVRRRGDGRARRDAAVLRRASRTRSGSATAPACPRGPSSSRPARSTGSLTIANLSRFDGAGVYYGATSVEAQLCDRR